MQRYDRAPGSRRFDVTSLGETMIRFSAGADADLASASSLALHVGGAESNVCSTLAQLGRRCGWYGRLPNNPLGDRVLAELMRRGVDTAAVDRPDHERLGLYFVGGVADRGGRTVVYDRAASAASNMRSEAAPWAYLTNARVLHLTGITLALSASCRQLVRDAIDHAKEADVAVSFDVNYRRQLWSPEAACEAMIDVVQRVDLLICAARDARHVFGLSGDDEEVSRNLVELSGARWTVLTLGAAGVIAKSSTEELHQPALPTRVTDSVGGGDALAAGVIDGYLDGCLRSGLRRGVALAAMALEQSGDMPTVSREALERSLAEA